MFKSCPALFFLAFLLVFATACNRDAADSTQNGSGAFLAPASAPQKPKVQRANATEGRPQTPPMREESSVLPGEGEPSVGKVTAEELKAVRLSGPGRMPSQPQTTAPRTAATAPPKTSAAPATGNKPVMDYERPVATVSKTACYGACRQFVLSLTNDRRLVLDAVKNMDRKGKYSRALSGREYNELLVALQAANPEGLAALYPNNIKNVPSDTQATILSFPDLDGNERKVEIYYDAPEKLNAFLTSFEAWVDKDGWIKMAAE